MQKKKDSRQKMVIIHDDIIIICVVRPFHPCHEVIKLVSRSNVVHYTNIKSANCHSVCVCIVHVVVELFFPFLYESKEDLQHDLLNNPHNNNKGGTTKVVDIKYSHGRSTKGSNLKTDRQSAFVRF